MQRIGASSEVNQVQSGYCSLLPASPLLIATVIQQGLLYLLCHLPNGTEVTPTSDELLSAITATTYGIMS